jgi:hypothetical protein
MMKAPYCVFVVLDSEYGVSLSQLVANGPVWILDTPINRAAAQSFWDEFPDRNHLNGVTVFTSKNVPSLEDALLCEIDTIDMHHNGFWADPPYSVLEIIGVAITPKIQLELSKYGFNEFSNTAQGFKAVRPLFDTSSN